jgi:S1-C subfamily serine protease
MLSWVLATLAVAASAGITSNGESNEVEQVAWQSLRGKGGELSSTPSCQSESGEAQDPAKEQRKQYIKDVLSKSKVAGKQLQLAGSGFFVSDDGSLITARALVSDCALISVSPTFGELDLATVVGSDEATGLALLRTDVVPPGIAPLIGSEGAYKRNPVYLLGYPALGPITTAPALTPVRVFNSQQTVSSVSMMLINGDFRSGYNGAPVLDSGGSVIGVVIPGKNQSYAAADAPLDNVGLAVPTEALLAFLAKHAIEPRVGLQLPPKPSDRLLIDSRPFAAQIGCWR